MTKELAKLTLTDETRTTLYDASWGKGVRKCDTCTLCCKLIAVRELNKDAGQRCKHQRRTGCRIYANRPDGCRYWNCQWLAGTDTGDMRRPDRSHYVVDVMPDHITMINNETGQRQAVPVIQVWVDPDFPDAHRDPALRAFLERRGREEGKAAIIRYSFDRAFILWPPALTEDRQWHEAEAGIDPNRHYDLGQTLAVLSGETPA